MARLDERITKAILKLLNDSHPNWVTQEEIYFYLEEKIEFNKKQLQLHEQKRGQIEVNWQHDARNLIHSLKRKGLIICPHSEIYGLSKEKDENLEQYKIMTKWKDFYLLAEQKYEIYSKKNEKNITIIKSNNNISDLLFKERIEHFVRCKGIIEAGSFHNWIQIEIAFVELVKELRRYEHHDGRVFIIHENLIKNGVLSYLLEEREEKILSAKERLRLLEKEKGKVRRTKERESSGIGFAIDKLTHEKVPISKASKTGPDVFFCGNRECGQPIFLRLGKRNKKHYAHTEWKKGMPECTWRSDKKDDGSMKWTISEKQRNTNTLDIKLVRNLMLGYQVLTIGDGLHGFPIDIAFKGIQNRKIKILESSNLLNEVGRTGSLSKLKEWSEESKETSSPSVKIENPRNKTRIRFTQGDGKEYNLSAKSLSENDLFLLDSPDDPSFTRVRPSSDIAADQLFSSYAPGQFIGVIQDKEYIHKDEEIINKKLSPLNLYLTIFNTDNLEHLKILNNKFRVNKKYSSDLMFDVLIAEPIESHPKTPDLIRVRKGDEVSIMTRFRSKEGDIYESPMIYLDTFVEGENQIDSEELADYYEDEWTRKRISARRDTKLKEIKVRTGDDYGRIQKPASGIRIRTFHDKRKPIFKNSDYFNPVGGYDNNSGLEMRIQYNDKSIKDDKYNLFNSNKKDFYVKNWDFNIDFPLLHALKNTRSICTMKVHVKDDLRDRHVYINWKNKTDGRIIHLQKAIEETHKASKVQNHNVEQLFVEWDDERLQALPEFILKIPSKEEEEIEKIRKEQEEAERIRIAKQKEDDRIAKQEEAERIAKQEEAERIAKKEEAERIAKKEEAERIAEKEEADRIAKEKEADNWAKGILNNLKTKERNLENRNKNELRKAPKDRRKKEQISDIDRFKKEQAEKILNTPFGSKKNAQIYAQELIVEKENIEADRIAKEKEKIQIQENKKELKEMIGFQEGLVEKLEAKNNRYRVTVNSKKELKKERERLDFYRKSLKSPAIMDTLRIDKEFDQHWDNVGGEGESQDEQSIFVGDEKIHLGSSPVRKKPENANDIAKKNKAKAATDKIFTILAEKENKKKLADQREAYLQKVAKEEEADRIAKQKEADRIAKQKEAERIAKQKEAERIAKKEEAEGIAKKRQQIAKQKEGEEEISDDDYEKKRREQVKKDEERFAKDARNAKRKSAQIRAERQRNDAKKGIVMKDWKHKINNLKNIINVNCDELDLFVDVKMSENIEELYDKINLKNILKDKHGYTDKQIEESKQNFKSLSKEKFKLSCIKCTNSQIEYQLDSQLGTGNNNKRKTKKELKKILLKCPQCRWEATLSKDVLKIFKEVRDRSRKR